MKRQGMMPLIRVSAKVAAFVIGIVSGAVTSCPADESRLDEHCR